MTDIADCSCSCDWGDLPSPLVLRERWVRARIPHTCCECGEAIVAGRRYLRRVGLWYRDEGWETYLACEPCERIRQQVCQCAPFGGLDEEIRELYGIGLVEDPKDYDDEED